MSFLDFLLYLVTGVITVCSKRYHIQKIYFVPKDIIAAHMNKWLIVRTHNDVCYDVAINFLGLP